MSTMMYNLIYKNNRTFSWNKQADRNFLRANAVYTVQGKIAMRAEPSCSDGHIWKGSMSGSPKSYLSKDLTSSTDTVWTIGCPSWPTSFDTWENNKNGWFVWDSVGWLAQFNVWVGYLCKSGDVTWLREMKEVLNHAWKGERKKTKKMFPNDWPLTSRYLFFSGSLLG